MVNNLPTNEEDARDAGSIPRSGRSPEKGNGNPLQYSCLENPKDRGVWWATVHGAAESDTTDHAPVIRVRLIPLPSTEQDLVTVQGALFT